MSTNENTTIIQDTTANPAPLGLLCFGMTTVILNLHNTGLFGLNSMIIGMGIFIGGLAQVIAGIQEWKKNNTFGATAFTAYGFFWLTLVATWLIPRNALHMDLKPDDNAMAWFLMLWGIFTLFMFIATIRLNRALQIVFSTLVILFFLLAWSYFTGNKGLKIIAGCEGVLCGLSAMYSSFAQVLNETYGKIVLPI